jgi:addiction module HigA family antidote
MVIEDIIVNEEGINGSETGEVDTTSPAFFALRAAIEADVANRTPEVQRTMDFLILRGQIVAYLEDKKIEKTIGIGDWLKRHLEILKIKNKTFAKYLNIKEPNLSAILKNRRKINIDFALKLEQLFDVKAEVWLGVQLKNELLQVDEDVRKGYEKYSLAGLKA